MRLTVNIDEQRIFSGRVKVLRLNHPGIHADASVDFDLNEFRRVMHDSFRQALQFLVDSTAQVTSMKVGRMGMKLYSWPGEPGSRRRNPRKMIPEGSASELD